MSYLKRRRILRAGLAPIVQPRRGNNTMLEPHLHVDDVGLVFKGVGGVDSATFDRLFERSRS